MVNSYWLEYLLNLFYQGYIGEVVDEMTDTLSNYIKAIEDISYGIIGQEFDVKHIDLLENKNEN